MRYILRFNRVDELEITWFIPVVGDQIKVMQKDKAILLQIDNRRFHPETNICVLFCSKLN